MSKYIDVDEVLEQIRKKLGIKSLDYLLEAERQIVDVIQSAPSIDIVRCKECKHWERLNYEAPKEGWCDDEMPYSDGRWVDADDFCSYGEREDE